MAVSDLRLGGRLVARLRLHHRKAALAALLALALLFNGVAIAGTVVAGNFGRSPAFPSTPNGRFPQETAQIIQFKQAQTLRAADQQAGRPEKTPLEYRKLAAGGVGLSALAMVGLGESAAQQSQMIGSIGGSLSAIGAVMCATGYGCAFGGPLAAVGAVMFLGSQGICLVSDCSIRTTSNGTVDGTGITGSEVRSTDKQPGGSSSAFTNYNDGDRMTIASSDLAKHGVGHEFVISYEGFRRAIFVPYSPSGSYLLRSMFGDMVYTDFSSYPSYAQNRSAQDMTVCPQSGCSGDSYRYFAEPSNCVGGYTRCILFVSTQTFQSANAVVVSNYEPVKQVPFIGLGSGAQLPPQSAAKTVSPDFMAQVANGLWQAQGQNAPVPYSDANKVTKADVDAYREQWPDRASNLADFARPISAPGQPPKIGPIDDPASPPSQVEVTNPAQETGAGGSSKSEEPDTELDDDPGLLGDVMQPARDFLGGDFAKFMTPGFSLPAASCPVFTIDLPTLLGHQDRSAPQSSAFLCNWFMDVRPLIVGILRMMYVFGALIIVFKRS